MSFNNQNLSETQPLLKEHVETGQELLRSLKYLHILMAVLICLCMGAALGIGIFISIEGMIFLTYCEKQIVLVIKKTFEIRGSRSRIFLCIIFTLEIIKTCFCSIINHS